MILRLIVAFTRWVWGVSPAFVVVDSIDWYPVMCFGALIDTAVISGLAVGLINWIRSRRSE